jgi:hypothetical protein
MRSRQRRAWIDLGEVAVIGEESEQADADQVGGESGVHCQPD